MRLFFSIICLYFSIGNMSAQFACGTASPESHPDIDREKFEIIKKQLSQKSISTDSVGLTIHIINNAVDLTTIRNEITSINNYFSGANLTFFTCGAPRFIDGANDYSPIDGDLLHQQNQVLNTINVYYVNTVNDGAGSNLCGYAFIPGFNLEEVDDRYAIISSLGGCLIGGTTLAHELGHLYGLLHTHERAVGIELVDGSNCSTSGDTFCDTPADPNLGRTGVVEGCTYVAREVDPTGKIYTPNAFNIMSYAPPRCTNMFSLEQLAMVRLIHETEYPNVLTQCNFFPDFEVLTNTSLNQIRSDQQLSVDYIFENLGVQDDFEVPVFIYLSDNPSEQGFIIKKDTISFSAFEGQKMETFDIDLPLNSSSNTYYLTVLIDPDFEFLELEETNNLFTLEFRIDNQALADELIFPNPTSGDFKLFIRDATIANTFVVSIYDTDGRLRKRLEGFKNQDEYFTEIDISEFREGLYIIDVFFIKHDERKTFKIYKTD